MESKPRPALPGCYRNLQLKSQKARIHVISSSERGKSYQGYSQSAVLNKDEFSFFFHFLGAMELDALKDPVPSDFLMHSFKKWM